MDKTEYSDVFKNLNKKKRVVSIQKPILSSKKRLPDLLVSSQESMCSTRKGSFQSRLVRDLNKTYYLEKYGGKNRCLCLQSFSVS